MSALRYIGTVKVNLACTSTGACTGVLPRDGMPDGTYELALQAVSYTTGATSEQYLLQWTGQKNPIKGPMRIIDNLLQQNTLLLEASGTYHPAKRWGMYWTQGSGSQDDIRANVKLGEDDGSGGTYPSAVVLTFDILDPTQ